MISSPRLNEKKKVKAKWIHVICRSSDGVNNNNKKKIIQMTYSHSSTWLHLLKILLLHMHWSLRTFLRPHRSFHSFTHSLALQSQHILNNSTTVIGHLKKKKNTHILTYKFKPNVYFIENISTPTSENCGLLLFFLKRTVEKCIIWKKKKIQKNCICKWPLIWLWV